MYNTVVKHKLNPIPPGGGGGELMPALAISGNLR